MKRNWFIDFILLLLGKEFTVVVKNRSNEKMSVTLFDAHNYFTGKSQIPVKEIKMKVWMWGYKWLLAKMVKEPFYVGGFKIKSISCNQMNEEIKFIYENNSPESYHRSIENNISPLSFFSVYQEENDYVDVYPFHLKFDGYLKMSLSVLPNEKVKLRFSVDVLTPNQKMKPLPKNYQPNLIPSL